MADATIVNSKGEKKVVAVGSPEAAQALGSGWQLGETWRAPAPAVGAWTPPNGATQIYNPAELSKYKPDQIIRDPNSNKVYLKSVNNAPVVDSSTARISVAQNAPKPIEFPKPEDYKPMLLPGATDLSTDPYPQAPDLVKTFLDFRSTYGLDALEANLNAAQDQLDNLDASYQAGKDKLGNSLSPMELIKGSQAELEQQYQAQRAQTQRTIDSQQRRLDSKNATVTMMMNFTQTNYDNARNSYNDKFDQAMKNQEMFWAQYSSDRDYSRAVSNDAIDRYYQEVELQNKIDTQLRDENRANLTTLMNSFQESGKSWDDIPANMKTELSKMELAAGLPAGSMISFSRTKPEAKLLASVNGTDKSGNDIVTFIYANKDGSPGLMVTKKTGGFTNIWGSGSGSGTKIKDAFMSKDASGGLNFTDDKGGAISAGQYAAFKGRSISSVLKESGKQEDKDKAAEISRALDDAVNKYGSNKNWGTTQIASQAVSDLRNEYDWLFSGLTDAEIASVAGIG